MTFEEEFSGLKMFVINGNSKQADKLCDFDNFVLCEDIQTHCLDKSKVRKILMKWKEIDEHNIFEPMITHLRKELEL